MHYEMFLYLISDCFIGGTDILAWKDVGAASSQYISGLSLELTNITSKSPVYYVSMKAENGAGILSSQAVTSTPIVVVPEDKAGKTLCLVHFTVQLNTTLLAPYEVLNKVIILKGFRSLIEVNIEYQVCEVSHV